MIRLHTFGGLDLIDAEGKKVHTVLQQPRRVALLVYLVLARADRWYRRDKLIALFWPDVDADHARGSLSQALYQLRRMLGGDVIASRGSEMVGLAGNVWCDAIELTRLLSEGKAEEAVALYQSPFLDGFFISGAPEFERWVDGERERLHGVAIEAFAAATDAAAAAGARARAIELARRTLAAAPTDEAALRRLLALLVRFGDRTGALRAYDGFAARLVADYDLTPSAATRKVVDALPIDESAAQGGSAAPDAAARIASPMAACDEPARGVPIRARPSRSVLFASAAALLLAGAAAAWLPRTSGAAHAVAVAAAARDVVDPGPSVAVLPFLNLSDSDASDYISDGLAEELITALTRVPALRVAARTSAFAFRHTNASLRDIGRALNVGTVVEGSVRRDGARLLITARLVDARTGAPIWSSTYDRRLEDILALQEEIARAIVTGIQPRLLPDTTRALTSTTRNVDAYNAYLKGRYHFNMRSPDHAWDGVHAYEQAVALDPTFAAAWSGLADAYALLPFYRLAATRDILARALVAAKRAAALDSTLAEPHSTLAWIAFQYQWDWATADREFQTALRLDPNYPDALHFYALFLSRVTGQRDLARAIAARAQRVDPLAPVIQAGAGAAYYHTRDFDASIAAHLHALALDSTYWIARGLLAKTYVAAGRPADALRELHMTPPKVRPIHGGPTVMGVAFAALGMRDSAIGMLRKARDESSSPYELALLYAALGDANAAFAALDRAVTERDPLVVCVRHEPLLDPLRGDPRLDRIADRIGLPR